VTSLRKAKIIAFGEKERENSKEDSLLSEESSLEREHKKIKT